MNHFTQDAMQANLGFVQKQTSHIEPQVYQHRYPAIRYPGLIPVDTSANPWATSVTYTSSDGAGQAQWVSDMASDIPVVGVSQEQFETPVNMAGIGYDYGIEEINQAAMLNRNLTSDKAVTARRVYEEMVDDIAFNGNTLKSFEGLFDYTGVPAATVPNGAGGSADWPSKTPDEIAADINSGIIGISDSTNTVALGDTILMPTDRHQYIASTRMGDGSDTTILEFIQRTNVYTSETGQPLTIRGLRGLDTKGAGDTKRMVTYRRAMDVLKMHIPMPHMFLPVQIVGLRYLVPGIFRLGGLDVRLPLEVDYRDGI